MTEMTFIVPHRLVVDALMRLMPDRTATAGLCDLVRPLTSEVCLVVSEALDDLGVRYSVVEAAMLPVGGVGSHIAFQAVVMVEDDKSAVAVKLFGDDTRRVVE